MPIAYRQDPSGPLGFVYSGAVTRDEMRRAIASVGESDQAEQRGVLVDLRAARLDLPLSEFMKMISAWYDTAGTSMRAAVILDSDQQSEIELLINARDILAQGSVRTFQAEDEARAFLAA